MSANLRAYLILAAVFMLGTATGGGAMYAHNRRAHGHSSDGHRGRGYAERKLAALTEQLKLSQQQQTQVAAILERQREPRSKLMHEAIERCGPEVRKLRAATDAELRALLTPDQQSQYDEILRARDKRYASP